MSVVDLAIHPKGNLARSGLQGAGLQRGRAFPIVIVGHVDHGKSTLVGRLLHDTDSLPAGKLEQLKAISAKRGLDFEWSFLLDALQVERDQGITVDTTQIWFTTGRRRYVIIDAPSHKEFLKNMVTGAAQADAAILVVDAVQGLAEQTRRDRTSVVSGTSVSVRVDLGGRRIIKNKTKDMTTATREHTLLQHQQN